MNRLVAVLFDHLGPYHGARLETTAAQQNLVVIEIAARSTEYEWDRVDTPTLRRITIIEKESEGVPQRELKHRLFRVLEEVRPDCLVINGWSDRAALLAHLWAKKTCTRYVVLSETQVHDERRRIITEFI